MTQDAHAELTNKVIDKLRATDPDFKFAFFGTLPASPMREFINGHRIDEARHYPELSKVMSATAIAIVVDNRVHDQDPTEGTLSQVIESRTSRIHSLLNQKDIKHSVLKPTSDFYGPMILIDGAQPGLDDKLKALLAEPAKATTPEAVAEKLATDMRNTLDTMEGISRVAAIQSLMAAMFKVLQDTGLRPELQDKLLKDIGLMQNERSAGQNERGGGLRIAR